MIPASRDFTRASRLTLATGLVGIAVLATVTLAASPGVGATVPPDPTTEVGSPTSTATLTLDRDIVEFAETQVGTESDSEVVTLSASGGTVEDIVVVVDGPFTVDDDCATLTDGQSCFIEIRFLPTEPGSTGGELVVESSIEPITAALGGTGTPQFITVPILTTVPPITVAPTVVPPTNVPATNVPPTDVPNTTVITSTTSSPVETRDECDARALEAQIRYTPALEMTVGESASIDASASIGDGEPDQSVAGPSTVVVQQALQCQVRARLLGGDDFTTNPQDWQEASFYGTNEISWRWVVTPRVVGEGLFLILEVQGMRFDADVGGFVPAGDSFNEEARISVDSRPRGFVSRVNDAVSGVVTHPLVAFAGAGGLVVLLRWGLQRRSNGAADNADDRPPT